MIPEQKQPAAAREMQDSVSDELQLRGGLKGRFFADFCLLQSTADALISYLERSDAAEVRDTAVPLLQEMQVRIHRLERLADNAADIIGGAAPAQGGGVWEMISFLQELCQSANTELENSGVAGRVRFEAPAGSPPFWQEFDPALVDAMFANLFSNSLCANPDASITVRIVNGGIEYCDASRWPAAACAQLEGKRSPEFAACGNTGLLLVYGCAQRLGWQLELSQAENMTLLRIWLLPVPTPAFGAHNTLNTLRVKPNPHTLRMREEFRAKLPCKK